LNGPHSLFTSRQRRPVRQGIALCDCRRRSVALTLVSIDQ
jgi:hypothetical protein